MALTLDQRKAVAATIRRHCTVRRWCLHALHVGEVHIHAVVTADRPADVAIAELKEWCSRVLNESFGRQAKWWTEGGFNRWLDDDRALCGVVEYVTERQTQGAG